METANDRYPLRPFRIDNLASIVDIVRAFPLATVITNSASSDATHDITLLPLMIKVDAADNARLIGHLDRNNPQADALVEGAALSFVFNGPNAYASPDLYDDAHLPGWLYVMVKGFGTVTRRLEKPETTDLLVEATDTFGAEDQAFELTSDDSRIPRFIGGIVAFDIRIDSLSCIAKLAQDKGPEHAVRAARFLADHRTDGVDELFRNLLSNDPQD